MKIEMRARIRKLAEDADAYADVMDVGGLSYLGLRDEYFATLIVRECANIYEAIDNGCTVEGTDDFQEALYRSFR